jgi:type VI secretion system protein ImpL
MKQLLTMMQGRKFLSQFSLSLLAIWFIGPHLAIAHKAPLEAVSSRIILSFVVFLFFFAIEFRKSSLLFSHATIPEEVRDELKILQKTLRRVLRTLHRNVIKSFLLRYKKPWYLVLGPTNAGKTTLLSRADLNIRGLDHLPPLLITTTQFFDWWLADEAVFIDVGSRYLRDTKESDNVALLFQGFFKLLKRYRRYKPINGLILTLNLQELTVNTKEQLQLQRLRQVIDQLALQFINFPIYVIVTRCDAIDGFVEFFEDLGPEERTQVFGINFPLSTHPQSLPQLFNDEYDALLKRLHERVIRRLHQEHNLDKVGKIKNFPLQMEFLKNSLAKLLNIILPNTTMNLRGIFFTSTSQKDMPFDNLIKSLSRAYNIHPVNPGHRATPSKNFFVNEIFQRIIFPETKFYIQNNPHHRQHMIISLFIMLISSACIFFFCISYKHDQQTIMQVKQVINNLNYATYEEPLIYKLNMLRTIIAQLNGQTHSWYAQIGIRQAHKLQKNAEKIYNSLLDTQFLDYLQRTLEIQLQNMQEGTTHSLYSTLKAYLMLGDLSRFDPVFFRAWFENYWQQLNFAPIRNQNLNGHLTAFLTHPLKKLPKLSLNSELITKKRESLTKIPQSRLVLTLLQDRYHSPIKVMPTSQITLFGNLPLEISGIFNILNFKDVYYTEIMNACREITHGDWVLGQKSHPPFSPIILNQLSDEVKAIYLNEYAIAWSAILSEIKLGELKSLDKIIDMIELLNNPQSPLIQLINTIKNNTQPLSYSIEFTQQISTRFLSLNNLSAEMLKNTHQTSLIAVKDYLSKLVHAENLDKACYEAARSRMEKSNYHDSITILLEQSKLLPEPLQTWYTTIAVESWRLILNYAQNYLNQVWMTTIYPPYQVMLDKRYPLFKESTIDASLDDFSHFFAADGIMDTFFKNYLQPFIDNSQLYWQWKNVDGQRINIPQTTLEMFIRADLIQRMFFPEGTKVPAITFSLVPVELDESIQSFNLNLAGQVVLFQKDNEQIISLSWPGPQPNRTEIIFINNQAKKFVLSEVGPWSWFKILDKCYLENTSNPKHFKLTFDLNGSAAHYELYTNNVVNPFILGILNTFRCPRNL